MPLLGDVTTNAYVKVQRLFTSSRQRTAKSKGTYEYTIDLSESISKLIGIELTGYSLPTDLAPSFLAPSNGFGGNDTVDFALRAGLLVKTFSFEWPNKMFTYNTYTPALQTLLQNALTGDPDFGGTEFLVSEKFDETTSITVSTPGVDLSFLWLTGANRTRSAYQQMGFDRVDTTFSTTVQSPNVTRLSPFTYCDVSVQEIPEFSPLKRIYLDNSARLVKNDPGVSRTRLLAGQPNRILRTLTVRLTLEGGGFAPDGKEHDLNFTLFCMQPEIASLPSWLKQSFVL